MDGFYEKNGAPLGGRALSDVKALLGATGLAYDPSVEFTTALYDKNGVLGATGSLSGRILKCVAVDPALQGQGLLAKVLTILLTEANRLGRHHLFLYTKPENERLFGALGFYTVVKTQKVVLMENLRMGVAAYLKGLVAETGEKKGETVGAIVANCNPFTKGHRYLMETAASQCDLLHLFILTDGKIEVAERMALVKAGTDDIANLVLHETGDYLVSEVTFPDYFIKERVTEAWYDVDVAVFSQHIAGALGITHRFVGTEPDCRVTKGYNAALKEALPKAGIRVVEIERMTVDGAPVSASTVRRLLTEGREEVARALVLPRVWEGVRALYGNGKNV